MDTRRSLSLPTAHGRILQPTRRELLLGAAGFAALAGAPDFRAADCVLTSSQVEGPYYIPKAEDRLDVRAGKPGVDLSLRLKIVDAATCNPIAGAIAEIWSCDAVGKYSGFTAMDPNGPPEGPGGPGGRRPPGPPPQGPPPGRNGGPGFGGPFGGGPGGGRTPTDELRFLRGVQAANDDGELSFLTLYPGWYSGRTIHVHFKVHLGGNQVLTSQLYFPDELTDAIHRAHEPYAERYPSPMHNAEDGVLHGRMGGSGEEAVGVFPTMSTDGDTQVGTLTIGVRRS